MRIGEGQVRKGGDTAVYRWTGHLVELVNLDAWSGQQDLHDPQVSVPEH